MKIAILTVGTFGDAKPNVALSIGLKNSGHDVRIVSSTDSMQYITEHGIDYYSTGFSMKELSSGHDAKKIMEAGEKTKNRFMNMKSYLNNFIESLFMKGLEGCAGYDLIISAGFGVHVGYHVGEALGIPVIPVIYQPQSMTEAYPLCFFKPLPLGKTLSGMYNKLTYESSDVFLKLALKKTLNKCRVKAGLEAGKNMKMHKTLRNNHAPIIYGFSSLILPRPKDYPDNLYFTGYFHLEEDMKYEPPEDFLNFLNNGDKPIHIGFGSITMSNYEDLKTIILESLKLSNRRGVILTGWSGMKFEEKYDHIYVKDSLPHDWLFPKMAATVHHGGAGTVFTSIRAGIPTIAVPYTMDTPFWSRVAYEANVAIKPIKPKELTAKLLADAITKATTDEAIIKRSQVLGENVMRENGVLNAVKIINSYLEDKNFRTVYFS